jgi:hypothetical protein
MKYPRTPYLPWSTGVSKDNKKMRWDTYELYLGSEKTVTTEKLDGSNVCFTKENLFARSHGGPPTHSSFDLLKAQWNNVLKSHLNPHYIYYGEWLFAKHNIYYNKLPSYLFIIGIVDTQGHQWLSWDQVVQESARIKIPHVPPIVIENDNPEGKSKYGLQREGYVIRVTRRFSIKDFSQCVGKCVRENHVTTNTHWKRQKLIKNKMVR